MRQHLKVKRAILVYQGGIANVFEIRDTPEHVANATYRKRLLQSDFRTCESFARGLACAGVEVSSMACNQAGDIAGAQWGLLGDGPFRDKMNPVTSKECM